MSRTMRVFLTGGTGYIGNAVLDALLRSHHHVDVLVRTSPAATALQARGAQPVRGSVLDPHTWSEAAARADGIVHAAAESGPRARQFDDAVVTALTSLAPRQDRFIIYTSGAWAIGNTPMSRSRTQPPTTSARPPASRVARAICVAIWSSEPLTAWRRTRPRCRGGARTCERPCQ